jgi:tRNA (Thr-GGU) A37 N-methylase
MKEMVVYGIGRVERGAAGARIVLEGKYRAGLEGVEGYGHVVVAWWMGRCDNPRDRGTLASERPYARGPGRVGVFGMRSPERPNPIGLSVAEVAGVDAAAGVVEVRWIDADEGSVVLDLKPYTPSVDRVERPVTPGWCAHWPGSVEASGGFDWAAEFNF